MKKEIKNANKIAYKFGQALTRAINNRLKVAGEERRKKEKMKERRK